MTDAIPPARRAQPRIPLAAAVAGALLLGVAGYALGHSQAGGTTSSAASCSAAQSAVKRQSDIAKTTGGDGAIRTLANMVVQRGDCFTPELAGSAQTLLDELNQGATAIEINHTRCSVKPNPWWSC